MPPNAPNNPSFYPIGVNLSRQRVLMVGAGAVAARKLARLLEVGALVTLVSPSLHPDCAELATHPDVTVIVGRYDAAALANTKPLLAFACTDHPDVNAQIVADCRAQGVWVNSATDGTALSDFIVPGVSDYGEIQLAIFTQGASPALIKKIKAWLDERFSPWLGPYATLLGRLRRRVHQQESLSARRQQLNRAWVDDVDLLDAIQTNPETDLDSLETMLWAKAIESE